MGTEFTHHCHGHKSYRKVQGACSLCEFHLKNRLPFNRMVMFESKPTQKMNWNFLAYRILYMSSPYCFH